MGSIDEHNFSTSPELVSANGLLFDFDGQHNAATSLSHREHEFWLTCGIFRHYHRQHGGDRQVLGESREIDGRRPQRHLGIFTWSQEYRRVQVT